MDKSLIINRFSRARQTYDSEAVIQQQIARKMILLLKECIDPAKCGNILEFGCGTGTFSRMLLSAFSPVQVLLNDICPEMEGCISDIISDRVNFCPGDAELYPFPGNQDLITSCSTLQWFNDPQYFFKRCLPLLSPEGYLAFSTFGNNNLKEVASVTGTGLNYQSKEQLEQALLPEYEIIYSEEDIIIKTFDSPLKVLYHLKQTGVTGVQSKSWTRRNLNEFCSRYSDLFTIHSFVSLTYHPVYIIAKKRSNGK